ncbi:MAG: helix-turn-helix transcriptional regulator [Anaerolineales bacterium]|nr:helix-turn-helix transcriptional regulator [Anaerolineales bacterium]
MGKDGIAEPAARRAGEEIARLRVSRGWTRWQLATRLLYVMAEDDPTADAVNEAWLARLETGRKVVISRETLEAFCRALNCTRQERARLLLRADRNTLADGSQEPDDAAEALVYVMNQVYAEARHILDDALKQRRAHDLDNAELLELVSKAIRLIARQ